MAVIKIVFVGRLEKDTGIFELISWLNGRKSIWSIDFVGDGSLRRLCEKFGNVHGFTNPTHYLKKSDVCIPGGYLSYIEAKAHGCRIMTFSSNALKQDYWKEIKLVKKFPSWDQIADEYISLYNGKK